MFDVSESHFLKEEENVISFFSEDAHFELSKTGATTQWIEEVLLREQKILKRLNCIFCSDDYLHRLNLKYLQHDTLTDIISFPYSEVPFIEGDLFISIDRVKENAQQLYIPFSKELYRVVIHGVLHLCGYGDKTQQEVKLMRQKESEMLDLAKEFGLLNDEKK
ncbi:MAG: rRNA maturation RNase YbeY [Bacteroidota bacterium]